MNAGAGRSCSVVLLLRGLSYGGVPRMGLNLLSSLQRLGYRPLLIVRHPGGDLWSVVPPEIETMHLNTLSRVKALMGVTKILRERSPDVLMTSGADGLIALGARTLAWGKTKIVIRQHGPFARGVQPPLAPMKRVVYRNVLRTADAFVAVSDGVAGDMANFLSISRAAITTIYNPAVTPDHVSLAEAPVDHPFFAQNEQRPVFLAVGRLVEQKDFATLITAFSIFRTHRDGRLVVIGQGPLRAALEAQCDALKVTKDVAFLGAVENPFRYMARATALVNSSVHGGLENVLVEALAAGAPVICTNCDFGSSEVLDQGRCGALVPVGDAMAMAAEMLKVTDRTAVEAKAAREIGLRRAADFAAETSALRYSALFERVLAENPAPNATLRLDNSLPH